MGAYIYRAKYKYVFGPITQEQFVFIEENVYCSDVGADKLSLEKYKELRKKFRNRVELKELFLSFCQEISKGNGHFSFKIFL